MVSPTAAGRGVGTCPGGWLRADGEQAVCRRIATRPVLIVLVGGVYTMLMIVFGLGHLDISESEPGAACDRAVLIGYGVANLVALLIPLDLSSNASVPMHIVATNMLLVLMLAAMGFGAAAFHGWLRLSSIASLVTESQALYRSWPRLMHRRQCWASASESASAVPVVGCSSCRCAVACAGGRRRPIAL